MSETQRKRISFIVDFVESRRQEILDNLRAAVEIPSPSESKEGTNQAGRFFAGLARELDARTTFLDGGDYGDHVLIESKKMPPPTVLFYGHMDTVFPVGTEWPFSMDGKRAYGPGVIDMKSGIITLLYALKALHATGGIPVGYKVLLNSDEELGSPNSRRLIPDLAKEADFAMIMEPGEPDGRLIHKRKGIGKFDIRVAGREAHAGKSPETGINAILELAHQVIAAERLARKPKGTTMNTGVVEGGRSAFIVPGSAHAVVESRVWTPEERKRIEEGMQALPEKIHVPGAAVSVQGGFHRPPLVRLPGAEKMESALRQAARELNLKVSFGGSGAASDGNNITALGIPVMDGLGPAGGREHSHDEYMEIESLFERIKLLACCLLYL